jgi:membrane protease YdiL (CAAX protease family)
MHPIHNDRDTRGSYDREQDGKCQPESAGIGVKDAKLASVPTRRYTQSAMGLSRVFINPQGRLRAGWRVFLFVVLFLITLFLAGWLLASTVSEPPLAANILVLITATVLSTWLMMRLVEGRPIAEIGLQFRPGTGKQLALGMGVGGAMAGAVAFAQWATGVSVFEPDPAATPVYGIATASALLLVAAANEEILFRGYPFQRLIEGTNVWISVLSLSALFGLVHYANNPHATFLGGLNTVLAGVWLSLAYVRTGGLWLPIGLHFSWNWTLAAIGLPVSGLDLMSTPWQVASAPEPVWLHGGLYGPEGGLTGTTALLAGIACLRLVTPGAVVSRTKNSAGS